MVKAPLPQAFQCRYNAFIYICLTKILHAVGTPLLASYATFIFAPQIGQSGTLEAY